MNIWELPGPGSFVRRVADAFRDGRSVIINFPEYAPSNFWLALRREYERDAILEITFLACGGLEETPLDLLFREFGSNVPAGALRNLSTLAATPLFAGRLISLSAVGDQSWPAWRTFLVEYGQLCRNIAPLQRTLFCAEVCGQFQAPALEDVCLAVFRWDDTVDETDISLWAAQQLSNRQVPSLERRLIVALLADLSLWDTETCAQLATHSLETLLVPVAPLQRIAHRRGWSAAIPRSEWWARGIEASVGGLRQQHSAFLAVCGEERALERRIWRAQLRLIFPAIEELRIALLPRLQPSLFLSVQTRTGHEVGLEEFEFGELASRVRKSGTVDSQTRSLVYLLKDLRHALAHLEPLREATALRRLARAHEQLLRVDDNIHS